MRPNSGDEGRDSSSLRESPVNSAVQPRLKCERVEMIEPNAAFFRVRVVAGKAVRFQQRGNFRDSGQRKETKDCREIFHLTGVRVKSLTAIPYCGGWSRQKRKVFSPALRLSVTGSEFCHLPTVKGISMATWESSTARLSR